MRTLRLYAPVIVALVLAVLAAVGISLTDVALFIVFASAVFLHIRAEHGLRE
jgi:hypothetical protein